MSRGSYVWARHTELSPVDLLTLSPTAERGYDYASELAEDAYEQSRDPYRYKRFSPLTIEALAERDGGTPATIRRSIALARAAIFGSLSDAAIYKRIQRQHARHQRTCAEANCATPIPASAPANKRYCEGHATSRARVRRHRRAITTAI